MQTDGTAECVCAAAGCDVAAPTTEPTVEATITEHPTERDIVALCAAVHAWVYHFPHVTAAEVRNYLIAQHTWPWGQSHGGTYLALTDPNTAAEEVQRMRMHARLKHASESERAVVEEQFFEMQRSRSLRSK